MSSMSQYLKNTVGFNVYTQDDPDLLTWLLEQWKATHKEPEGQTFSRVPFIEEFVKFGRDLISQRPVVAMEYIDSGIAIVLSTGEKIPFNKSSTVTTPDVSINVMGASTTMAQPRVEPQIDTSAPITGGGK